MGVVTKVRKKRVLTKKHMPIWYGRIHVVNEEDIVEFMENFRNKLIGDDVDPDRIAEITHKFYTNNVRIRYSKEKQHTMWDTLMQIASEPGGITWMCDNLEYFSEYSDYRWRNQWSIESKQGKAYKGKRTIYTISEKKKNEEIRKGVMANEWDALVQRLKIS